MYKYCMAIDNLEHARDVKYIITETINKIYKKKAEPIALKEIHMYLEE